MCKMLIVTYKVPRHDVHFKLIHESLHYFNVAMTTGNMQHIYSTLDRDKAAWYM